MVPVGWTVGFVGGLCVDEVVEEAGEVDVGGVVGEFLSAGGGFGCVGVDVWWWFGWVGDDEFGCVLSVHTKAGCRLIFEGKAIR